MIIEEIKKVKRNKRVKYEVKLKNSNEKLEKLELKYKDEEQILKNGQENE